MDILALPGFIAERDGERVGLLTYSWDDGGCELAGILVRDRRHGVGTELVESLVREVAGRARIWLVTSNDNLSMRSASTSAAASGSLRSTREPWTKRVAARSQSFRETVHTIFPCATSSSSNYRPTLP